MLLHLEHGSRTFVNADGRKFHDRLVTWLSEAMGTTRSDVFKAAAYTNLVKCTTELSFRLFSGEKARWLFPRLRSAGAATLLPLRRLHARRARRRSAQRAPAPESGGRCEPFVKTLLRLVHLAAQ